MNIAESKDLIIKIFKTLLFDIHQNTISDEYNGKWEQVKEGTDDCFKYHLFKDDNIHREIEFKQVWSVDPITNKYNSYYLKTIIKHDNNIVSEGAFNLLNYMDDEGNVQVYLDILAHIEAYAKGEDEDLYQILHYTASTLSIGNILSNELKLPGMNVAVDTTSDKVLDTYITLWNDKRKLIVGFDFTSEGIGEEDVKLYIKEIIPIRGYGREITEWIEPEEWDFSMQIVKNDIYRIINFFMNFR